MRAQDEARGVNVGQGAVVHFPLSDKAQVGFLEVVTEVERSSTGNGDDKCSRQRRQRMDGREMGITVTFAGTASSKLQGWLRILLTFVDL